MKKSKISHRNTIWFLHEQGKSRREILEEMRMVYRDERPSRPTIYKGIKRFEEGWYTYEDTVRAGRPKSSGLRSNVQLIERILDEDRRATVRELEERSGIPKSSIHRIIQDELEMARVVGRWVPKLIRRTKARTGASQSRFTEIMEKREKFLDRIVTGDKTWFHYYEPETKCQSSQWKRKHECVPIKIKSAPSAGKRMATVFWDRKEILSIDWLPGKTTINSDYYISEFEELLEVIKRERRGKLSKGNLL